MQNIFNVVHVARAEPCILEPSKRAILKEKKNDFLCVNFLFFKVQIVLITHLEPFYFGNSGVLPVWNMLKISEYFAFSNFKTESVTKKYFL